MADERRSGGTPAGARSDLRAKLLDRFRGALFGVAIGDALGAPFEGAPPCNPSRFSGWENGVPHPLRYTAVEGRDELIHLADRLLALALAPEPAHRRAPDEDPGSGLG